MHPIRTVKKVAKKTMAFMMSLPIMIKIISVLLLCSFVVTAVDWVVEIFTAKNNPEDIYSILEVEDVEELVEIKESPDGSGYYLDFVSDFDEKINEIVAKANNSAGLHNLPTSTEFMKKIIKAEVITQFPDLGGNIPEGSDGFQGAIDIRRVTPNKEIGSIDDNPGRGETSTIEKETVYDTVTYNKDEEEKIKEWVSGQKLLIKGKAYVYEQTESKLNPGSDTGDWNRKLKESTLNQYVSISDGTEVTYTGTYKANTNELTKETTFYVEVKNGDEKVFVKSSNLTIKSEEGSEQASVETQKVAKIETTSVTSRAKENNTKTAGKEGETYTIAIAAGHNNSDDTGARSGSLKEEELTIKTAEKVEELLSEYSNIEVVQVGSTSENRSDVKVTERKTLARNANPDLCIQIHFDAGGGSGVQAIYKEGDGISEQLAEMLSESMASSMGLPNNGAGPDVERCAVGSLGIIENAATSGFPSVVTEGGFVDGEPDATLLKGNGTDLCAEGIVEGILKYLKADHSGYTSTSIERETVQESIESKVYNLKYVTQDELENLITNANNGNNNAKKQVLKVYTLDDDNNLITTSWEMKDTGNIEYKKNSPMNFRTALQKYIMPYEYLLYFYIDTNEIDFSEKLADEVLDTEIVIAVQDNITTTKTTEITREKKVASIEDYSYEKTTNTKVTITEICSPKIEITYADAWCAKYYKENSYSSKALDWKDGDEEKILNIKGKVTVTPSNSTTGYNKTSSGTAKTGQKDEDGNDITYSYTIYNKTDTEQNTMSIQYDSGEAKVKGNENKFVKAYQDTKAYIKVREYYLFEILENNEKTVNLLDLTKYLMYKATGMSYGGIVEYDFNEFDLSAFSNISGIYGSSIQEKVWFAILDAGYSKEAAAGVMGNIEAESGFRTSIIEGGSGIGVGLCQWSFGRRTQLEAYAASKGVDWTDENTQVEFLVGEITPGGGADGYATYQLVTYKGYSPNDWKNASSPEDAAIAFCWCFERPGTPRMDVRTQAARKYYEEFKDKTAPSGDSRIGTITLSGDNANKMMAMLTDALRIADDDSYTYVYGAGRPANENTRAFDCSSFVAYLYKKHFDITLPAQTESMFKVAQENGNVVSMSSLQPGDILYHSGHVAIYIGNNQDVEAMSTKKGIVVTTYNPGRFTHAFRFVR